jgi:hypothetical protein
MTFLHYKGNQQLTIQPKLNIPWKQVGKYPLPLVCLCLQNGALTKLYFEIPFQILWHSSSLSFTIHSIIFLKSNFIEEMTFQANYKTNTNFGCTVQPSVMLVNTRKPLSFTWLCEMWRCLRLLKNPFSFSIFLMEFSNFKLIVLPEDTRRVSEWHYCCFFLGGGGGFFLF